MPPNELALFAERLEEELGRVVETAATGPEPWVEAVACAERLIKAGGKRVRPRICLFSYLACGGGGVDMGLVRFAAGIELLHTCMLVHDDVMDRSEVRRGVPSVHRAILDAGLLADPRLAEGLAIVVGDVLATLATEEFVADELPADRGRRAAAAVHRAMRETAAGQVLDLISGPRPIEEVSEEEILLTYRLKTACFAFEAPLRSGAILAGASDEVCDALAGFGIKLGTAFQLRDDLIGFFGTQSLTGKRPEDDLREGKKTLLLRLLWERCGEADRALVAAVAGTREPTGAELEQLREAARETAAADEVERRIAELSRDAVAQLRAQPLDARWRDHLVLLAAWLERRAA
jgi:geranylgeranyl diphosphate synthase type I